MPLSLAEIKSRAIRFSNDWATAKSESEGAQTFWNEFFAVFGRERKVVATFEEPVKNLKGQYDFMDLFWPGVLIAEHKSRGKSLEKAKTQAIDYARGLVDSGRGDQAPEYIIVSDFARIALHNLSDPSQSVEFDLGQLHKHIHRLAFIAGYTARKLDPEDPANERAVEKLANLHDQLEYAGFKGHALERFLVRVLFCLFAEDTGIFDEPECFKRFLLNHTRPDGSDLGPQLARLFQILDTAPEKRPAHLSEDLNVFPHVNGRLFSERLDFPEFTSRQRVALLDCANFQWARISPAVFGSLFQNVIGSSSQPGENKRRQIGAHYTSERDIMKLIRSLFLDDLHAEFKSIGTNKKALQAFHEKIAALKFLDPACGCGNFLVITYRELRILELEIIKARSGRRLDQGTVYAALRVDVNQMYGIEIEEWPARIAEVALWLLDHQMNQMASESFGQPYRRIPITASPHIIVANALEQDWNLVVRRDQCSYILGNPPFVGKHLMTTAQSADMRKVCGSAPSAGVLDYVTAWYFRAAAYIHGTKIRCAFVSTNSITQGEQVGPLWNPLFREYGLKIHFAHRTFKWISEARGKAHVHVVIIGFGPFDITGKKIHDYGDDEAIPQISAAANISPYLVEGPDMVLSARSKPVCSVPECQYGNKPTDGGHLIVEEQDRQAFLKENPAAKKYLRPLLCAEEYIHNLRRWCLWLVDAAPQDIRDCPGLKARIEAVRAFRLASKKESTRRKADQPTLFAEIRQPTRGFVIIPRHSSETRFYIPFGYFTPTHIVHDSCTALLGATPYHFGVLSSAMHMAWIRQVAGRIKSDYRYSSDIVYNNFPWPDADKTQMDKVRKCAQVVLDVRTPFLANGSTLADLYDPLAMPPKLLKAHHDLDRAVEKCYRPKPFTNERERFEFLFRRYEQMTSPLLPNSGTTRKEPRT